MRKMKHDLEYLAELIDGLDRTKMVLTSIYYDKASECPHGSYDKDAFETFCNHPNIIRGIHPWTDCRHCRFYHSSEEVENDADTRCI